MDDYIHNTAPIEDEEEIEVLENRGEHVNKSAELNWQGEELLSEYLNDDSDPELIVKRLPQINHTQQMALVLNTSTLPPAGDFGNDLDEYNRHVTFTAFNISVFLVFLYVLVSSLIGLFMPFDI